MSENDKLSFNESEEEEFHITDEDIDRELAAMEIDQSSPASDEAVSDVVNAKPSLKERFAALKKLKRKHWIIIILIVIILLFGLLKWIGTNQSEASFGQITPIQTAPALSNNAALETKPVETDLTKAVVEPNKPTITVPVLAAPKTDVTAASDDTKLTQELEAIQQQNQALTQQLTALSSRVVGLESTLTQSNQAVEDLSQQVVTLQKGEAPAAPLPRLAQSLPEEPQYTVEAVVPQRAWLQTKDGSTITVMVHDDVPGLGSVVAIDPYSGNVTMTSGAVIKYGS